MFKNTQNCVNARLLHMFNPLQYRYLDTSEKSGIPQTIFMFRLEGEGAVAGFNPTPPSRKNEVRGNPPCLTPALDGPQYRQRQCTWSA